MVAEITQDCIITVVIHKVYLVVSVKSLGSRDEPVVGVAGIFVGSCSILPVAHRLAGLEVAELPVDDDISRRIAAAGRLGTLEHIYTSGDVTLAILAAGVERDCRRV